MMSTGIIVPIISIFWIVSEIVLARFRQSGPDASKLDRSSLRMLWTTIALSVSFGVFLGVRGIGSVSTGSTLIAWFGLILIFIGLGVRWTAILTLRKSFTVDVSIRSDQRIVDKGIYRFVRHPAYAGSLLSFLGLGVSFSNWMSAPVIFFPILLAFLYRIRIEERALLIFLGDGYIPYCASTKRLIPGLY